MWILLIIVALIAIATVVYTVSSGRHYGRMFSDANFRAFHNALSRAIEVARGKSASSEFSLDDGTAFVTDAGLGVSVTLFPQGDGSHALHIAMSQAGRHTTHSVCSRFGFFTVAMLKDNKAELVPYFTASSVHHLVFRLQSPDVAVQDFDATYSQYRDEYRPIPFQYQNINGEQTAAANG
jgi:hypothetical protein